ncbi:hypothetical protein SDJN02_26389, partial [Cucurbita argyrosperma subsp. argyrosperma]
FCRFHFALTIPTATSHLNIQVGFPSAAAYKINSLRVSKIALFDSHCISPPPNLSSINLAASSSLTRIPLFPPPRTFLQEI